MNRWERVEELFHAAKALPPERRAAYLLERCPEDEALRREVQELLERASSQDGFLSGSPLPSDAIAALPRGKMLGRFEIAEPIGAGGMGRVYRARDERLRRDVAIKVLAPDFARDADRMRRFEREARAAGGLNHPNILAIFDIGVEDGALYVVSELLEGETLRRRLGRPLAPRKAIEIARQVAAGLAVAHAKGIVHRDLKPENIFLASNGAVKILDFGLAKLAEAAPRGDETATLNTASGAIMGTPAYMSPEQLRGEPVDHRSDIFAFGVVLFEMLAGRRPFEGNTFDAMIATVREDAPDLDTIQPGLPHGVGAVVRHCLEKRPEDRFDSARDLSFALGALESASGTAAVAAPALASKPAAHSKRIARWALAIGAAALALAAGWFGGYRTAPRPVASYRRLTFRRGIVASARFAPDGRSVVYSAAWNGEPLAMFSTRPESSESRPFGFSAANILAISPNGEMALTLNTQSAVAATGTLARAPLAGGAPREWIENVGGADWSRDGSKIAIVRAAKEWQLEYPPGTVLFRAPPNTWISHPRIAPNGRGVAFFHHDANPGDTQGYIAYADLAGHKTVVSKRFVDLSGLAWGPSGDELWATVAGSEYTYSLAAFTLQGGQRTLLTLPLRVLLYDIAADGRLLLGQEAQSSIVRGVLPGDSAERDLSWQDGTFARAMTADGGALLFDEEGMSGQSTAHVFLRRGGTEPVRLGDGFGIAISPDGKWALTAWRHTNPRQLWALPTGAGDAIRIDTEGIDFSEAGSWFPDSRRIAFVGHEPGRRARAWMAGLDGDKARPITPEGSPGWLLTPDGAHVVASSGGKRALFPTAGGEPVPMPEAAFRGLPLRFSADGKWLFMFRSGRPDEVVRVDMASGRAEPWLKPAPPDMAGVLTIFGNGTALSADGRSYAYTAVRALGDLFLVSGVR